MRFSVGLSLPQDIGYIRCITTSKICTLKAHTKDLWEAIRGDQRLAWDPCLGIAERVTKLHTRWQTHLLGLLVGFVKSLLEGTLESLQCPSPIPQRTYTIALRTCNKSDHPGQQPSSLSSVQGDALPYSSKWYVVFFPFVCIDPPMGPGAGVLCSKLTTALQGCMTTP